MDGGSVVRTWLGREPVQRALLSGGVTALVLALYLLGTFEWLELWSYDLRYAWLPAEPLATPVLLVRIDEESEARLGVQAKGISRAFYAEATRRLAQAGATLIAFDIVFAGERDPEEDAALAEAIAEAGNVILARYIGERSHNIPLPLFSRAELGEASINVELDRDGVLRHVPLISLDLSEGLPGEPFLAMGLEVARLYVDPDSAHELDLDDPSEVRIGPLRVPVRDGRMRIAFHGLPGTFPRLPFWRAALGEFAPEDVRGKIVLIGASAPTLHDYYQTPYTARRVQVLAGDPGEIRGVRMDGFEIHANAIQTILSGRYVRRSADWLGLVPALVVAVGLVSFLLFQTRSRSLLLTAPRFGLLLGPGLAAYLLFWRWRYWLDVVPLYALAALQYTAAVSHQRFLEAQKRREIQAMFGRYVSARVVAQLVKNPELANPSGRKERLTVFFSDVRGFTSMSEQMEPLEVQRLLGEYFTEMTRILFTHGGTLDKFMGDAVMAFFGNPEPQPDHALRAVLMALEMQEAIEALNRKWAAEGRRTIGVGMGINTGEVTVGNLGSKDFLDYTVIGDTVNLACRLEQNAKAGEIIITQTTYDEVKGAVEVVPLEPIRVKGKSEPIPIYRVFGRQ
ncbi:CHASE2 domain-containing protein [Nitrospira sp. Kam-Ns4a]